MIRLSISATFAAIVILAGAHALAGPTPSNSLDTTAALLHLEATRIKLHIPGMALAVVRRNKTIIAKGLGYRDLAKKLPVTTKTLFGIGSTTKAMTAAGLGLLVARKKLAWHTPVRRYMPKFQLKDPYTTAQTSAIDLLTHRTGLPRHDLVWYGSPRSRKQLFTSLQHLDPSKGFRTHFQYNNLMYMVAGMLAEARSGMPWEKFMTTQLFSPIGMRDVLFSVKEMTKRPDFAKPYLRSAGKLRPVSQRVIDAIGPAGSVNANLADMIKWVQWQLAKGKVGGKQLIPTSSFQMLHTPHMVMNSQRGKRLSRNPHLGHIGYSLGWMTSQFRNDSILFHTGGIGGYAALVSFMPRRNIGLIMLTNRGKNPALIPLMLETYERLHRQPSYPHVNALITSLKKRAIARRKQAKLAPKPRPNTRPSHPLTAYAGVYRHPAYGEMKLSAVGKALKMSYHTLKFTFQHFHDDVFQGVNKKGQPISAKLKCVFQLSPKGAITSVSVPWQAGVAPIVFARTSMPPPKATPPVVKRTRPTPPKVRVRPIPTKPKKRPPTRLAQLDPPPPMQSSSNLSQPAPTHTPPPPEVTRVVPRVVPRVVTPRVVVKIPPIVRKAPAYRKNRFFINAVAAAKRLGRPIFLDLYAEWCAPCKRLERDTFSHPLVHPLLAKYYVVRFDIDRTEGKALVRRFGIRRFPTTLMLSPGGKEIERVIGYYAARYFRPAIKAALTGKHTFRKLLSAANRNPKNRDIQLRLADRLVLRRQADTARTIYTALWKGDPKNAGKVGAWALFGIARSYTRMGMYAFALPWLQQFQKQFATPTNAQIEAYRLMLYSYKRVKQTQDYQNLLKVFRAKFPGKSHEFK